MLYSRKGWIPNATNTHPEYVTFIADPRQQRLHERAKVLTLYAHCLSCYLRFRGKLLLPPIRAHRGLKTVQYLCRWRKYSEECSEIMQSKVGQYFIIRAWTHSAWSKCFADEVLRKYAAARGDTTVHYDIFIICRTWYTTDFILWRQSNQTNLINLTRGKWVRHFSSHTHKKINKQQSVWYVPCSMFLALFRCIIKKKRSTDALD
jgi:hypothetical protein